MKRVRANNGNRFARFGLRPHRVRTNKDFRGGRQL